jgi:hypothetical protein
MGIWSKEIAGFKKAFWEAALREASGGWIGSGEAFYRKLKVRHSSWPM